MARPIIDDVVHRLKIRNPHVYYEVIDSPIYAGDVRDANKDVIKLNNASKTASKLGIIEILKTGVESFALEPGEGQIITIDNEQHSVSKAVDPCIIKLIKVSVVASYSQNDDYAIVLTELARQLLHSEHINLPLPLPKGNKSQEVFSDEVNQFLKEYLDKNGVKYFEELQAKRGNKLLQAAEAADV